MIKERFNRVMSFVLILSMVMQMLPIGIMPIYAQDNSSSEVTAVQTLDPAPDAKGSTEPQETPEFTDAEIPDGTDQSESSQLISGVSGVRTITFNFPDGTVEAVLVSEKLESLRQFNIVQFK